MPRIVPQHLKAESTIEQQPDRITSKIMMIMYLDLAGRTNKAIAEIIGIGEVRISVIKNSPLYTHQKEALRSELERELLDKQGDKIVAGDPVENLIKDKCLAAAEKKIALMDTARSEMVQSSAASDILGIGGYMKKTSKTTTVIEVDSKMASRWERVLSDGGKPGVRITREDVEEE